MYVIKIYIVHNLFDGKYIHLAIYFGVCWFFVWEVGIYKLYRLLGCSHYYLIVKFIKINKIDLIIVLRAINFGYDFMIYGMIMLFASFFIDSASSSKRDI